MPSFSIASDHRFHNGQKIIIQDKFVDLRVSDLYRVYGVPVTDLGYDYYYKVISDAERDRLAEVIAQKVFEKLVELGGEDGNVPVGPVVPSSPGNPTTPAVPNPANPDDLITARITQLFKVNCSTCHTGEKAKGGFSMFTEDGTLADLTTEQKWNIFDRIDGSNLDRELIMPKNGKPLEQADVDLVREWIRKGK